MVPVTIGTAFLVWKLNKVAKETGSLVVKSDVLHYATDLYMNVGVLFSLILVKITGVAAIDSIVSLIIAAYMLYSAGGIVKEGISIVMDGAMDDSDIQLVKRDIASEKRFAGYHDLRTKRGKTKTVDFHVTVDGSMTVSEMHDVFMTMRKTIRKSVGEDTKVLIHADPV